MKNVLTLLTILMPLFASAKAETASVYTDLQKDCIVVSSATELAEIDFEESECKAFAGYALKIEGGDLRYGPSLSFQGQELNLKRPLSFHNMGSQKVEWVYDLVRNSQGDGTLKFKALIYRLSVADSSGEKPDQSVLYVVRLDGKKTCSIGTRLTNEEARQLANDKSAKCVSL